MGQRKSKKYAGLFLRGCTWWMSFTYQGEHWRKSTKSTNKAKAQEIYDILKGKIASGTWHPETLDTVEDKKEFAFAELVAMHDEWAAPRHKAWKQSGRCMSNHLSECLGDILLDDFTAMHVEQFQSAELARGKSPAYINRQVTLLKAMFTKAVDWNMTTDDILRRVRKVKALKGVVKRLRYLSRHESMALVSACDTHLKPIVMTALLTGMRKGEILDLKWNNVDLRHGFILLDKTKNGDRREIPINNTLRGILTDLTRRLDIEYVFYDRSNGKPYGDIKKSWASAKRRAEVQKCTKCDYQKAKDAAGDEMTYCPICNSEMMLKKGIEDFHFHDLRHTFASQMIMAGVDITTVSRLLGHKSLKMTLRYSHLSPAHNVEALKKMDAFFGVETNEISTNLAQSAKNN